MPPKLVRVKSSPSCTISSKSKSFFILDKAAITTIKKLGLDLPLMNQSRNQAIEVFLDEELTEEEFDRFVYDYLQKDNRVMFGEFWTTIKQLFGLDN